MRLYIADSETPNALTAKTFCKSDRVDDLFYASHSTELFRQLGIGCARRAILANLNAT